MQWQPFCFDEIFNLKTGYFHKRPINDHGTIPFLGSTDSNNGITAYLTETNIEQSTKSGRPQKPIDLDQKIYQGPAIVANNSGSVGHAYFQNGAYTASDHTTTLTLKNHKLTKDLALFLIPLIEAQSKLFSFARQWSIDRMKRSKIILPINDQHQIDWDFMAKSTKQFRTEQQKKTHVIINHQLSQQSIINVPTLDEKKWSSFPFKLIFDLHRGYYNKKPLMNQTGDIPFLGGTDHQNGITGYTTLENINNASVNAHDGKGDLEEKLFKAPAIAVTNNGSIGHAYYQTNDFTCSHDISVLYVKHEHNENIDLFLATMIEKQGELFHYARKWQMSRMINSKIMLPVNNQNEIDWKYMNNYIENLKQADLKQVNHSSLKQ